MPVFSPIGDAAASSPMLLHEIFDDVARRYPDRVAIEIPPGSSRVDRVSRTYRELCDHADALAGCLARFARADAIIAILLPRDTVDLYAAQLAVLKAGAAFTCADPKFPDEHLRSVLEDAGAEAIITDDVGRGRLQAPGCVIAAIIDPRDRADSIDAVVRRATPSDLAYVIYTSGTTGKPKGVMIEHRSIVNLITSDVEYFGLTCDERVAQCSSPAYDSSIEETWLALATGATLVPLDDETVRLGPDLVGWLARERITVLCPPPTLLRTMGCIDPQRELPELKLLYVGGEALPGDLADLWSAGRWMENGYGPTECTVTVVRTRIFPREAVTIGTPVRGAHAMLLDANLAEVADGEAGELCIAGVSLARGYRGREELTGEKFPEHALYGRIYRTGDLVRRNLAGKLEYLGRIDSQVKLRGYRIELEAIEAVLAASAGVRAAACKVQGDGAGQVLVAHVVPTVLAKPPDVDALKQSLRRSLPEYMVPARFGFLDSLPTSVGGKLDRNALGEIQAGARAAEREMVRPRNAAEQSIAAAFARALKLSSDVSIHDDFFLDLGGDSLAAVGVICDLRAANKNSAATVRDLYEARTIARMAELAPSNAARREDAKTAGPISRPRGRPMLSTIIQLIWLASELIAGSAVAYVVVFELLPFLLRDFGLIGAAIVAPLLGFFALLVYTPLSIGLVVTLKRILIGRYRAMSAPVWGGFFTRHWIVCSAARLIPWSLFESTMFTAVVLRVLGAKVGWRVHFHRGVDLRRGGWDLLTIGDDVTLCQDAGIRLVELEAGQLIIGPITIGDGATLDTRAGMSPGSTIERNGYLTPLSWLSSNTHIKEGELWDGVPAIRTGKTPPRSTITRGQDLGPLTFSILILLGHCLRAIAIGLPAIFVAILSPLLITDANQRLLEWLSSPRLSPTEFVIIAVFTSAGLIVKLIIQALSMRLMGAVRPGVVGQYSLEALRIWAKTALLDSASRWLSGAIFWPWWLRLAGMRIDRGCEISTIIDTVPETVSIGSESFFADGIYFCSPRRHRGTITIANTTLGLGTFLGNHAVIESGHEWPDGLFVGVSTPADAGRAGRDSAWFGHPPMELPRREVVEADRRLTYNPSLVRYLTRLFWELMRFSIPLLPLWVGYEWYARLANAGPYFGRVSMAVVIAPILSACAGAFLCMAIVALKWVLLGRVRPGQHAFWSCWCGRWDFLFMAWGFWARGPLGSLEGTLVLNAFLRLTGMRIGKRVVLGPGFSQVVDPDMLRFDDDATVTCHFQAHSFEDRILKIDRIHIRQNASVGENAVVFYGVQIGESATVSPHSVVMKRDRLQANTRYTGCPTKMTQ